MIASAEKIIEAKKGENSEEQIKQLKEEPEAVKDSVNALLDYLFGLVDDRQGITREPEATISAQLERPEYYISSGIGGPSATERELMKKARRSADNAITKINSFFNTEWTEYVKTIESAELSPFRSTNFRGWLIHKVMSEE
ncbi:MAG: hypothetical protein U5K69_29080 [Balneolaceae bacterium]|nr:hypothetical protein [Balneolaceae bacterium]